MLMLDSSLLRYSTPNRGVEYCDDRVGSHENMTGQTTGQRGSDPSAYRVSISGYYNII